MRLQLSGRIGDELENIYVVGRSEVVSDRKRLSQTLKLKGRWARQCSARNISENLRCGARCCDLVRKQRLAGEWVLRNYKIRVHRVTFETGCRSYQFSGCT